MPGEENRVDVKVWDLPVRLFHWVLAVLFVVQIVTGKIGGDLMPWHMASGYAVLALIIFRILWGFAGGTHARFASFIAGPAATLRFAVRLFSRQAVPQLGHNPLGGWSVMAMVACFALQAITGLFANDGVVAEGPLTSLVSLDISNTMSEIHRANLKVLVVLSVLHIAAVFFHMLVKRENLVRAMFTGVKRVPADFLRERREAVRGSRLRRAASRENAAAYVVSPWRGLLWFIVAVAVVSAIVQVVPMFVQQAPDRNIPGQE